MRIASFNVQNLRLRKTGLNGARDRDVPDDTGPAAEALDPADRHLTAQVIRETRADLIALQEVFDLSTLDHFHDQVLRAEGVGPYPYRICLPGNDGSGLDLAVLSRRPLNAVFSHIDLTPAMAGLPCGEGIDPDFPIFRRDCLEVSVAGIWLFLCHFKAPWPDAEAAWPVRRLEAEAVRWLIARRFPDPMNAEWLVLGDLNEPAVPPSRGRATQPLTDLAHDLLERLPQGQRWSYKAPEDGPLSRPDAVLASPALARRFPNARPELFRKGMGREVEEYHGARLPGVGWHRPHASDHAAVVIDLPDL